MLNHAHCIIMDMNTRSESLAKDQMANLNWNNNEINDFATMS